MNKVSERWIAQGGRIKVRKKKGKEEKEEECVEDKKKRNGELREREKEESDMQ